MKTVRDTDAQWEAQRQAVLTFIAVEGRRPSHRSTDRVERSLNAWLHTQRQCAAGSKHSRAFTVERLALLADDGLLTEAPRCNDYWRRLAEFVAVHGRYPANGNSSDEAALAQSLYMSRALARRNSITDRTRAAIIAAGLDPDVVLADCDRPVINRDERFQRNAEAVAQFHTTHSRVPSSRSADPGERPLGNWVRNLRNGRILLDATQLALLRDLGIAHLAEPRS